MLRRRTSENTDKLLQRSDQVSRKAKKKVMTCMNSVFDNVVFLSKDTESHSATSEKQSRYFTLLSSSQKEYCT